LNSDLAKGPFILVCLIPKEILPEDFDLDTELSGLGITTSMAPNIVEREDLGLYELVIAQACAELLSTKLHRFKINTKHKPFAPAESDIRIHGIVKANRRARVSSLRVAVKAIRKGWRPGTEECYRNVIAEAGLETTLERENLNWDIRVSHWQTVFLVQLLMLPRKPIHRSLRVSRKTSCSLILICHRMITVFSNATKTIGFSSFGTIKQISPSY